MIEITREQMQAAFDRTDEILNRPKKAMKTFNGFLKSNLGNALSIISGIILGLICILAGLGSGIKFLLIIFAVIILATFFYYLFLEIRKFDEFRKLAKFPKNIVKEQQRQNSLYQSVYINGYSEETIRLAQPVFESRGLCEEAIISGEALFCCYLQQMDMANAEKVFNRIKELPLKSDISKILALNIEQSYYFYNNMYNEVIRCTEENEALLSEFLMTNSYMSCSIASFLSIYYLSKQDYKKALEHSMIQYEFLSKMFTSQAEQSQDAVNKHNDAMLGSNCLIIAECLIRLGNYDKAVYYINLAKPICDSIPLYNQKRQLLKDELTAHMNNQRRETEND